MAVRRETVRLELIDDGFSTKMLRDAVATATLERALKSLDGTTVRIDQRVSSSSRQMDTISQAAVRGSSSINQLTGRLKVLGEAILTIGPGLIPIAAVGIPAVTGLASALGFAAIGAGSLVVAAQGVGDALKTMNEAALDPTAANLEKAREAMAKLGPEAQNFVRQFQQIRPVLTDIRDAAAAGWFPGLVESFDSLEFIAPRIADIFQVIGETGGNLLADGARALAGPEWTEFLEFVEDNAPQALDELGRTVGNLTLGLADLWMAFSPLNQDFSTWLLEASRGFALWADGLSETEGFEQFVDYIRASAPQVRDTLASIADAVVEIITAASPLGGPVLEAFELIADVLGAIAATTAGSRILTMAAAFVILNKALALTGALLAKTGFMGAAGAVRGAMPGGGAPIAGGTAMSPLAQRVQGARTSLAQFGKDARVIGGAYTSVLARTSQEQAKLNAATARTKATVAGFGSTAAKAGAGVGAFAVASGALGSEMGLQNTAMLGLVGAMTGPWGAAIGAAIGLTIDITKATELYADAQERISSAIASQDVQKLNEELAKQQKILAGARDSDEITGVGDAISDVWRGITGGGSGDLKEKAAKEIERIEGALRGVKVEGRNLEREKAIERWAYTAGSAFLDLAADIKKPETSLADLMKRMRDQGRAARDMGKNLREAIRNGADPTALQELIDKLGPEAGLALEQLAAGGKRTAREFNASWGVAVGGLRKVEGAIARVGEEIARLPNGVVLRVTTDTLRARAELQRLEREAKSVAGDYRINYIVTQTRRNIIQTLPGGRDGDPATPIADGGTVPGPRQPYRDKVLAYLAPGEEVITNRNGEADRYRADRAAGRIPAYANGGTVQALASGGRVGALDFAGLPALNLASMSLAKLNKALAASTKALENEKTQRDAVVEKISSLRGDVTGRFRSDLFGETNSWSAGSGFEDVMSTLSGDIASARDFNADRAMLQAKGLTGAALDDLLRNGDAATIDSFANQTRAALTQYASQYNVRQSVTASVGAAAGQAAYGAELVKANRELRQVVSYQRATVTAIKTEGRESRRSTRRGAGAGARNRRRG